MTEIDRLREALEKCRDLFGTIRCDFLDPRAECREGEAVVAAALAATPPGAERWMPIESAPTDTTKGDFLISMQEFEKYPELARLIARLGALSIEGLSLAQWGEFLGEVNASLKEARQRGVAFGPAKPRTPEGSP